MNVKFKKYTPQNLKKLLMYHEVPNLPYETIRIDICEQGSITFARLGGGYNPLKVASELTPEFQKAADTCP